MKQRDLIKKLEDAGFTFERHGGNHDIYRRGKIRLKCKLIVYKSLHAKIWCAY